MKSTKWLFVFLVLAVMIFSSIPVFAEGEEADAAEKINFVSQNCASIKLQLQRTQKADSRERVYLGTQYENISTNLIQNLNLRLVRNDLANADLSIQQTKFASKRTDFNNSFVTYSQEMDKLIAIDCKAEPQKFYEKLKVVRIKRRVVRSEAESLRALVGEHEKSAEKLNHDLFGVKSNVSSEAKGEKDAEYKEK